MEKGCTMKMKTLTLLALGLMASICSSAQKVTWRVQVFNDAGEPLKGATLTVFKLPDSSVEARRVLASKDSIQLTRDQLYAISITATGFQPFQRKLIISSDIDSGFVYMSTRVGKLENVTVVSRKQLLRQEDDKTIVDAEPLAVSSTNAYEVLEKTPGAIVDQDGNVYLNSATPATVFINGREVKLSSADLASLLKSLPANSIQKVEILRSPSAKYDAASSGGIVNIVLKKGIKIGLNGSLNMAHFQGRLNTSTTGFNLNNNDGKWSTYLSYQYTKRNNFEELRSDRLAGIGQGLIKQESYTKYPSQNHYVGGGFDYAWSERFSVGYDLRVSANKNRSSAGNGIDIFDPSGVNMLAQNFSIIGNNGKSLYWGNNISTKYKIDSLGSEWTTATDFNIFRGRNSQEYDNYFELPVMDTLSGDGKSRNNKTIFAFQTDLVLKLPAKFTFESGLKYSESNSRTGADYFLENNGNRKVDSFQTNQFRYKEQIASGYVQLAKTFGKFTIKPGVRLEYTDISGRQLFPGDTSFSIRRTDIFPYLYLRQPIVKLFGFQLTGNLILRRSISRPYYEALNPYPRYIDQFLYDVGNPNLKPQFTNNYEFNVMADDFPIISVGLNDMRDIFTSVTYQDDATKIVYRTFDNLGRNRELYLRFVGGIPPGGKYFFYMGAQHNRNQYTGFYQNQPLDYTRGSWVFFMYHNLKTSPTFNVSLQGFMRLRGLQNFYELGPFGALNLTLNKAVMKKKANIIVSVNDIFRTNQVDFNINQPGINAFGNRLNDTRRVGLTLRYNFGIRPKEEKKGFDAPAEAAQ